jgi:UDP-N-acetylglucosamine 2-epimerase
MPGQSAIDNISAKISPVQQQVVKLRRQVADWIDETFAVMRDSQWQSALQIDDVDLLEAVRAPLLQRILKLAREDVRHDDTRGLPDVLSRLKGAAYNLKVFIKDAKARSKSARVNPVDVLFWPQLRSHTKEQEPVAKCLRAMGISAGFLLNQADEFECVRRLEADAVYVGRVWSKVLRKARREGESAAHQLSVSPGRALPQFVRNISEDYIISEIHSTIVQLLPIVYQTVAAAEAAIDQFKPKVLVVGNDLTLEGRTQCMVAAKHRLATACIMHGIVSGEPFQAKHVANAVIVYSKRMRQELIGLGEKPERIRVCGSPSLTKRKHQTGVAHPAIKRFLGLEEEKPWVLLATSGPGHSVSTAHHKRLIAAVMRLSVQMPNVKFVAKLHPKDRLDYYHEAQRSLPESKLMIVPPKSSLGRLEFDEWLQGCTAIITGGSAAAIDAMLKNVPVISIDLADELLGIAFIEYGATVHVRSEEDLSLAMTSVLSFSERSAVALARAKEFVLESFQELDGNPSMVAAHTLLELMGPALTTEGSFVS